MVYAIICMSIDEERVVWYSSNSCLVGFHSCLSESSFRYVQVWEYCASIMMINDIYPYVAFIVMIILTITVQVEYMQGC